MASEGPQTRRGSLATLSLWIAPLCLILGGVVAWLNAAHQLQSGIYRRRYLALAEFLRGEGEYSILTYPVWGYSLLLAWLPAREHLVVALQVLLATAVLLAVFRSAAPRLRGVGLLAVLTVLALPWYALASVKLADVHSASFAVLGLCALVEALRSRSWRWALGAGLLFGVSVNFRNDFLPIVVGLPVVVAALAPSLARSFSWRWAIPVVVTPLCLVPWGIFRVQHGVPFGITTSNAGMVLYNSLGFEGNAWGIVRGDVVRAREIQAALGEDADAHTMRGNEFFRERFLDAVLERPDEFVRKVGRSFLATFKYGFYEIEVEPFLDERTLQEYEIFKEQLKSWAGGRVNQLQVEEYRERGLWEEDFSPFTASPAVWAVAAWPVVNSLYSAAYLALLLVGIGLVAWRRDARGDPVFAVFAAAALMVWGLVCLIQYEQRQTNVLYVLGLPLVCLVVESAFGAVRRGWGSEEGSPRAPGRAAS